MVVAVDDPAIPLVGGVFGAVDTEEGVATLGQNAGIDNPKGCIGVREADIVGSLNQQVIATNVLAYLPRAKAAATTVQVERS